MDGLKSILLELKLELANSGPASHFKSRFESLAAESLPLRQMPGNELRAVAHPFCFPKR
jgi:hypothetical protein